MLAIGRTRLLKTRGSIIRGGILRNQSRGNPFPQVRSIAVWNVLITKKSQSSNFSTPRLCMLILKNGPKQFQQYLAPPALSAQILNKYMYIWCPLMFRIIDKISLGFFKMFHLEVIISSPQDSATTLVRDAAIDNCMIGLAQKFLSFAYWALHTF